MSRISKIYRQGIRQLPIPSVINEEIITYKDGVRLPMTVVGKRNKPPVLLLHAFGMDARQFIPFVLPMLKQYCFYMPHFRGYGLSAHSPTTRFDFIEQYADDVEVILKQICSAHAVQALPVAAISMGALVMWAYFSRYTSASTTIDSRCKDANKALISNAQSHLPPYVSHYLNIDQSPVTTNQPDWQGGVFGNHQQELLSKFSQTFDEILPYCGDISPTSHAGIDTKKTDVTESSDSGNHDNNFTRMGGFNHLPYPIKKKILAIEHAFSLLSVSRTHGRLAVNMMSYRPAYKTSIYEHPTWQQKMRCMAAYLNIDYDYRAGMNQLHLPITLLIGGKSQLYDPKWQHRLADILPCAKVVEIKHSGHAIPLEAPIAFINALRHFVQQSYLASTDGNR